jgi:hypothetical protein
MFEDLDQTEYRDRHDLADLIVTKVGDDRDGSAFWISEAQAQAFRIADNRLSEMSEWNDHLLAEQFKELSVLDLDFDLEVTGFETGEIDFRIESLSAEQSSKDGASSARRSSLCS